MPNNTPMTDLLTQLLQVVHKQQQEELIDEDPESYADRVEAFEEEQRND